jgi:hypothetical protein
VALRPECQRHLYDATNHFEFLVTESVPHWSICPPEVLLAQFDRLLGGCGSFCEIYVLIFRTPGEPIPNL